MTREERAEIMNNKLEAFKKALVKKYGENAVITYAELAAVFDKGNYAKWRDYAKNQDYKVGRNLYVVTTSKAPKTIRNKVKQAMKQTAKKETSAHRYMSKRKPVSPLRKINKTRQYSGRVIHGRATSHHVH